MNIDSSRRTVEVLGVSVHPLDMQSAVARIREELDKRRSGFVCLIGVHGVMEAQRNHDLAQIYAHATLMVPDGTPTVWVGRLQGFSKMQRVAGPDLMLEILSHEQFAKCRHFLYGGKDGVAEELRERLTRRFPWVQIVGTYTPPFRELTLTEEESLAARIEKLNPDMIWVGISTPKQERFMMRFLPRLKSTLMFGVGAAFDFHTGRIKDAPQWVKRSGLQWFHRMIQDPRRLFWRYFRNNSAFLWHITLQWTGLRTYPQAKADPNFSHSAQTATNLTPRKASP